MCAISIRNRYEEYLFEESEQKIKIRGFSGALRRTCKSLDIPFRPMHKIRKTYGTTLLDNQVSETLVAYQMGHSDISTTQKYYYRNNKAKEHKAEEIERALSTI
ncbi:MAG: tyrosine-type recombinase/integrase [Dorea sp.]|nr:tyrosine-type recombinase/integrase [Dorea sp.]